MIKANLGGEMVHIIKSITNVIGFLGETKGGDPVPLRKSEVNRMLGKVDELAVNTDNVAIFHSCLEKRLRLLMDLSTVSMELLRKSMKKSVSWRLW